MTQGITDGIYKIEVPMKNGGLNFLNSYLILGERNLLIDTGFDTDEAYDTIMGALKEHNTSMAETDIFLTHMHPDHAELAGRLSVENTKVYMGAADVQLLNQRLKSPVNWRINPASRGFPPDVVVDYERIHALKRPFAKFTCSFTEVRDGDVLEYGGYRLVCIDCAGHSPGQTCLYLPEKRILFAGDHILYDITPNVSVWDDNENPLKDYICNLKKLRDYDIDLALPAHRSITCSPKERIDQILEHHEARLNETLDELRKNGAMSPYAIASGLTWNTGCTWEELPPFQKYSAVGEVIAHLTYLMDRGIVEKETVDDVSLYRAKG